MLGLRALVEYLAEYHNPGGNAFKIVWASEVLEEIGFTVDEFHEMALEAYAEKMVLIGRLKVKGNRWGVDQMIPGDIDTIAIKRKGLEWYKKKTIRTTHE